MPVIPVFGKLRQEDMPTWSTDAGVWKEGLVDERTYHACRR